MSDSRKATAERAEERAEEQAAERGKNAPWTRRINYICDYCGSDDICFEAFVYWSVDKQCFEVPNTCDKGHVCGRCGVECTPMEIELKDR